MLLQYTKNMELKMQLFLISTILVLLLGINSSVHAEDDVTVHPLGFNSDETEFAILETSEIEFGGWEIRLEVFSAIDGTQIKLIELASDREKCFDDNFEAFECQRSYLEKNLLKQNRNYLDKFSLLSVETIIKRSKNELKNYKMFEYDRHYHKNKAFPQRLEIIVDELATNRFPANYSSNPGFCKGYSLTHNDSIFREMHIPKEIKRCSEDFSLDAIICGVLSCVVIIRSEYLSFEGRNHEYHIEPLGSLYPEYEVQDVPVNDTLNIRSAPSNQSKVIGELNNGQSVNIRPLYDPNALWGQLLFIDRKPSTGWVYLRYLSPKLQFYSSD